MKIKFKLLIVTLFIAFSCFAQSLDTSFSNDGKLLLENIGVFENVVVQNDGKLLFFGKNEVNYGTVFRLNSDGSYDNSFGVQGKLILNTIGLLSNLQINLDGSFFIDNGNNRLLKINNNGTVDNSFNNISFPGFDYVVHSTGKITAINSDHTLIRYNSNGTIDTSFGNNGILTVFTEGQKIVNLELNTTTNDIYILDSGNSNSNYKVWKLLGNNSLNNSPFIQGSFVWTTDFQFHNNILYLSGHSSPSMDARLTKLNVNDLTVLQTQNSDLNNFIPRNQISFNANNTPIQLSRLYSNQYDTNIKILLYASGTYTSNLISANFPEIEYLSNGSVAADNFLNKIYFVSSGYNKVFIARFNYPTLSVSNFELSKINIWPNPIENTINLSTEIQTGEIYNIEGKKINLNISGKTINVANLSKGIYILKGTDIYERHFTVKFIKN